MATQKQIDVVATCHRAFSDRDADAFVANITEDALMRPSAFITGRDEYRGIEDVRIGFGEVAKILDDTGEDITIEPEGFYIDAADDRLVMSHARLTIIRADGETYRTEIAYLWTMEGDKVSELAAWLNFEEGLEQLGNPEEVSPSQALD